MVPLLVQTAYMDLLQRFEARPQVSIPGSILRVKKSGRTFHVSRRRVGGKVVEESIGPDTAETRELVRIAEQEKAALKDWDRENAELVGMIRKAGAISPDMGSGKILNALSRIGFFSAGGILGGTAAFRFYPLFLGIRPPVKDMVMTGDIDMLAPSHIRLCAPDESLSGLLRDAGLEFTTVFPLEETAPPRFISGGIALEILSNMSRSGEYYHLHKGIGEKVTALKFLEYSMKDPVRQVALYRSGVEILTPSPERFAFHKLIVAQLRTGSYSLKRTKDLAQADWLIRHLVQARPQDTWDAWQDIRSRGKGWTRRIDLSLKELPHARKALDRLEQDMQGHDDLDEDFDDDLKPR